MNLLVDTLQTSITIDGTVYPIETDFRACLRIILAFEQNLLTSSERNYILLMNLYGCIPSNVRMAVEEGVKFLDGPIKSTADDTGKRYYSFAQDANFIYAAFKQTHSIDLSDVELHWWKFIALFMDTGQATTFSNLVSLRKRVKDGKGTKEDRRMAEELGELFVIPDVDVRTPEQKQADDMFMNLLGGGK